MDLTIKKALNPIDMLLYETQYVLWDQVIVKICHTTGWKDEKGEEQDEPWCQTWVTLQLCQNEYLLNVFKKDVAEQMRIYLTFHVKKLTRILVCVFMQRLEQMNTRLPALPSLPEG